MPMKWWQRPADTRTGRFDSNRFGFDRIKFAEKEFLQYNVVGLETIELKDPKKCLWEEKSS